MSTTNTLRPAIVIPAYNRAGTLTRLLDCLGRACYPGGDIPLIISIDRGSTGHNSEVHSTAKDYPWPYGDKRVILQADHLGLVKHIHWCSSQTKQYGSIILLEDDLYVSPMFYLYASQALTVYQYTPQVAGIALYSLWFNGYTHQPFIPLPDDSDIFFLQIPYSQGQAFTSLQWQGYDDWLSLGDRQVRPQDNIHPMMTLFGAEEWFPTRTKYLVENDLYYVYPRQSLSTSFGDPGTHFTRPSPFLQAPLQRYQNNFRFKSFDESTAVYDSFFEMHPGCLARMATELEGISFDVDLYATKRPYHLRTSHVLTTRSCQAPVLKFAKALWPLEANIIDGIKGEGISLCRVEDLEWGWLSDLVVRKNNQDFFTRKRNPGKREIILFWLVEMAEKLGFIKAR